MIFLFKKQLTLSTVESAHIQEFVGKTIEKMLTTKEETLNTLKRYDLVLICSWEGNYLVVDMYQLSKFAFSNNMDVRRKNTPFFSAARSLYYQKELIVYFDEHKEKGMMLKNLLAFYYVLDLLTHVEVTVVTSKDYRCVWQ